MIQQGAGVVELGLNGGTMIETVIQKAEREAYEAETRLIHIKAVLAAYPNAEEGWDGRLRANRVDVVGMEWAPAIGPHGAFVFFGEIATERGPARVYDHLSLHIDDMPGVLPGSKALARDLHTVARAAQITREQAAISREREILTGKAAAFFTANGEVTTDPTKADPKHPEPQGGVQRPLPEHRHEVAVPVDVTRAS